MLGREGALCLSWSPEDAGGAVQIPRGKGDPDEDKHKAPTSTQPRPLSLQDGGALL